MQRSADREIETEWEAYFFTHAHALSVQCRRRKQESSRKYKVIDAYVCWWGFMVILTHAVWLCLEPVANDCYALPTELNALSNDECTLSWAGNLLPETQCERWSKRERESARKKKLCFEIKGKLANICSFVFCEWHASGKGWAADELAYRVHQERTEVANLVSS